MDNLGTGHTGQVRTIVINGFTYNIVRMDDKKQIFFSIPKNQRGDF